MKHWIKAFFLALVMILPIGAQGREDELAEILEKCLLREMNSPDSIEYNLALLEKEREGKEGVQRALYTACLAQLYSMRAYSDATGEWSKRSKELFIEALANPQILYDAKTKDYLPIVERGKDEKIWGSNMLYVVWRAANQWANDSIMSEEALLDFYTSQGNNKPAKMKAELKVLLVKNDSIMKHSPRLTLRMAEVYYPGDSLRMHLDTSNVSQLVWSVYDNKGKLVSKNPLLAPQTPGRYVLRMNCQTEAKLRKKPKMAELSFVVSRLQAFSMDMPNGALRTRVVDAMSGAPLPEAIVTRNHKENTIHISLGADSCLPEIRHYGRYNYNAPSSKFTTRVAMFTDRAIYRPGQSIKLSAIMYEQKHWEARVKNAKQEYKVKLTNNEGQLVSDTMAITDEFGTLATEFLIPTDASLGWYTIWIEGHAHGVMVEEYKRPTFYVEMDEQEVRKNILPLLSDSGASAKDSIVTIGGSARNYDGTPLRGARVTALARRLYCWWWRNGNSREEQVVLDTIFTDMEGRFALQVPVSRLPKYKYAPTIRVDISVLSAHGETQTGCSVLRLFDDPPMVEAQAKDWLECPVDTFDAHAPAQLEFRNKEDQPMHIFLTGFAGEQVVIDTMMILKDSLRQMSIPYLESYTDGMRLVATYVSRGEVHTKHVVLRKRLPNNRLSLHWQTFRDYTQPGATERWTLHVLDAQGQPAEANVMLTMYDASLNAFQTNDWDLSINRSHYIPYSRVRAGHYYDSTRKMHWHNFDVWTYKIKDYKFSQLDMKYFQKRGVMAPRTTFVGGYATKANVLREVSLKAGEDMVTQENASEEDETDFTKVDIRFDFRETAFFMPQLQSVDGKEYTITFTMPQSLTTWQLNGIAHTKDMRVGTLTEKIVARKALMSKLHLPRFVRQGDDISFAASLTNTSDHEQKGKMQIVVSDVETEKVLVQKTISFKVGANNDSTFHLQCQIPESSRNLRFKLVASAGKDSDGEQRDVPVLTSVIQVAETQALTIEPGKSMKLSLEGLFPAMATDKKLIVEKVLSPMQTAIDALPKVVAPQADDVLSYASAYYAAVKLGKADTTLYINKLSCMQKPDGSMPWYDGLAGNVYLTREVGYLLARLSSTSPMAQKVLSRIKTFLADKLQEEILRRKEYNKDWEASLSDLRTLYVLVKDGKASKEHYQLVNKVMKRLPKDWETMDSEYIAIAMLVKHAQKETVLKEAVQVLHSRLEHSDGAYLAYRGGAYPSIDRRLHIHTQVMEAWQTVVPEDSTMIKQMQLWLLNQKRTQGWKSPIDCINAVFALTGGKIDTISMPTPNVVRDTLDTKFTHKMTISNTFSQPMWVAVYAEYFLPMDSIDADGTDFALTRSFSHQNPSVGDRVTETYIIEAKRDYEFVVLSVPRSGATEPCTKLSTYGWQKGVNYYMQVRETHTDYFIPQLPHGRYVLQLEYTAERSGQYSTGVPTIKCCYAEEFRAHGTNHRLSIKD